MQNTEHRMELFSLKNVFWYGTAAFKNMALWLKGELYFDLLVHFIKPGRAVPSLGVWLELPPDWKHMFLSNFLSFYYATAELVYKLEEEKTIFVTYIKLCLYKSVQVDEENNDIRAISVLMKKKYSA